MRATNQQTAEPTGWLFKFNNGRKQFVTDPEEAFEIISSLEEGETFTEYTGKDLEDAIRRHSGDSNEEVQALREKCEELGADKERYFRLYESACVELQDLKSKVAPPPLTGRWHHGNGVLVSGTIRIAQWDCDTTPPKEFRDEMLDWVCSTLNTAIERYESQRSKEDKKW